MPKYKNSKYLLMLLAFIHGATLMAIIFFSMLSSFEDGLYSQIVNRVTHVGMSDREKAISLLHQTHTLLKSRLSIFGGQEYINLRDTLFRSADIHLLDAKGACGSHSHVLGRMLQQVNIPIRIAQMKCKGNLWGCHIVIEAKLENKYVVLDPLFDLVFEKDNGELASFVEVGKNWDYFKNILPENYDKKYAYEDVRYTNWEKIPVLMPTMKKILRIFIEDNVDTLSIRAGVLNIYKAYAILILIFYAFLLMFSFFIWRAKKHKRVDTQ